MAGLFVLSTNTVSAKANLIPANMSSSLATVTVMLQEEAAAASEDRGFTQILKEQFIQGGAGFIRVSTGQMKVSSLPKRLLWPMEVCRWGNLKKMYPGCLSS